MLRDILNLADVFTTPLENMVTPAPEPCNTHDRQEIEYMTVPETIVSTGCSVDRTLITVLEMGCRYFFKRRVRCLDLRV